MAGRLSEKHGATSWAQRLTLVESALLAGLARHGAAAEVRGRTSLAALTRGATVRSVADDVGWSRRHLGSQVRAESGLTPKEYQRVARFERSHRRLLHAARAGRVQLGTLARTRATRTRRTSPASGGCWPAAPFRMRTRRCAG